ncbi:hypothetical protein FB451DRAFT_1177972 [Mycena latifolia]|nr:hypothetical protein FB451DRAFT_1177972 [Mycena latifolia]
MYELQVRNVSFGDVQTVHSSARRRKIKCDGTEPCNQCRLRPPRSGQPCIYTQSRIPETQETSAQMTETIRGLKARIEELELVLPQDPSSIYLNQPYFIPESSGILEPVGLEAPSLPEASPSVGLPEPSSHLIVPLIDICTGRFAESALFFLDLVVFRQSALLPLPFGDPTRPCPALLCAVYLWGSVLADFSTSPPYTPDAFLLCCLQNIAQDVHYIVTRPKLLLETIQAEVLLSLYYMRTVQHVPGRYHSSAAVTIALCAGLHLLGSGGNAEPHDTPFPIYASSVSEASEEERRIDAFWAVVILNNYWVASDSGPSSISDEFNIDTPWPSSPPSLGGATVMKFLTGDDSEGSSHAALLSKTSILLERVITLSAAHTGPLESSLLVRVEARLDRFQASLPAGPGTHSLILARALTDSAIIRIHAVYAHISASSRSKCLAAAARIASTLGGGTVIHHPVPILGEMAALCERSLAGDLNAQLEYCALDAKVNELIRDIEGHASSTPVIGKEHMPALPVLGSESAEMEVFS